MQKRKLAIIIMVLGFVVNGIDSRNFYTQAQSLINKVHTTQNDDTAKKNLEKISLEIMKAVQNKDLKKLSTFINPKHGLMISLSPYIEKNNYVKLTPKQLINLNSKENKKVKTNWGIDDGSGKAILLTFEEFHKKFLWPVNYLGKDIKINYNNIPNRSSSSQNYKNKFKNGIAVEYYFKGTKKYSNMDWKSNILIYEKTNNKLYLSAIIIDHWRP